MCRPSLVRLAQGLVQHFGTFDSPIMACLLLGMAVLAKVIFLPYADSVVSKVWIYSNIS